jgi:hypothetical protein
MSTAKRLNARDEEGGTDALAYTVTSPANLEQLDDEIRDAMNWRKESGLVVEGILGAASEDNPVVLWVTHENTKAPAITKAISDHEPDPDYVPSSVGPAKTLEDYRQTVLAGEPIAPEEVMAVLRLMLAETHQA